ncbi:GIY-YIG nuclease family protein [Candidatus Roizmanbacteria bacterium]|nr:GIY-YIG nuclease family protein [Candidatus Roizmanbacteria bacterium]
MSFVYILSNKRNGTLYIGVTSNLLKRIYEHQQNVDRANEWIPDQSPG